MRVIAGKARRLALKTVPGMETRPTTDRIKETLFNILQPEIPDCRFLDLFSGKLFECQIPFAGSFFIRQLPKFFLCHAWRAPFFTTARNVSVFVGRLRLYSIDYSAMLIWAQVLEIHV